MSSQPIVKLMKMMTNNLIAIISHSFKLKDIAFHRFWSIKIFLIVNCAYINLKLQLQKNLIFTEKYEMLII